MSVAHDDGSAFRFEHEHERVGRPSRGEVAEASRALKTADSVAFPERAYERTCPQFLPDSQ